MIKDDFKIDFENKKISYTNNSNKNVYTAQELYSYIQDLFDEPVNLKYDIPLVAKSKTNFKLINGWRLDKNSLKYLKGNIE
ncbi:hypothetical protein HZA76_00300 [Candidatus Roizmanbacteria bacterium]|nr:hypothetical protein [Candidatus Roizmanbacteria bacterium]